MYAKRQFTTRGALSCLAIFSLTLSFWAARADRQRVAVREIERHGGVVIYGESSLTATSVRLKWIDVDFVLYVEEVYLYGDGFGGKSIVRDVEAIIPSLRRLPHLRRVYLSPLQQEMASRLRSELPHLEVNVVSGSVPLVG